MFIIGLLYASIVMSLAKKKTVFEIVLWISLSPIQINQRHLF